MMPLDDGIRKSAINRIARIKGDLASAGPHYPRDEVRSALDFWKIAI
jgi:hypothetical protein